MKQWYDKYIKYIMHSFKWNKKTTVRLKSDLNSPMNTKPGNCAEAFNFISWILTGKLICFLATSNIHKIFTVI